MPSSNIFVELFARVIASFGFGLSVFLIWLRWIASPENGLSPPLSWKGKHENVPQYSSIFDRGIDTLLSNSTNKIQVTASFQVSHQDYSHYVDSENPGSLEAARITREDLKSSPPKVDLSHPPGVEHHCSSMSVSLPSTPIGSIPPPTSPISRRIATLEDFSDLYQPPRRSSSTFRLISKVKFPFRTKLNRSSFLCPKINKSSEQLQPPSMPVTAPTNQITSKKLRSKNSFTASWCRSRSEAEVLADESNNQRAVVPSRMAFSARFSWPSCTKSQFSSRGSSHSRFFSSSLLPRRLLHQQISTRSRTSPYEAPYFACPPIPFGDEFPGSRATRPSGDSSSTRRYGVFKRTGAQFHVATLRPRSNPG